MLFNKNANSAIGFYIDVGWLPLNSVQCHFKKMKPIWHKVRCKVRLTLDIKISGSNWFGHMAYVMNLRKRNVYTRIRRIACVFSNLN